MGDRGQSSCSGSAMAGTDGDGSPCRIGSRLETTGASAVGKTERGGNLERWFGTTPGISPTVETCAYGGRATYVRAPGSGLQTVATSLR